MLEKPDLQDEKITACLQAEYGLEIIEVEFLPLGADRDTAVYRVVAKDGNLYFLKLRSGAFDEVSVELPKYLSSQGIEQIIAPVAAKSGLAWSRLDSYTAILYPFIEGRNAYQVVLTDRQWIVFGAALKRIHTITVPAALKTRIPQEHFSSFWRNKVTSFLKNSDPETDGDIVAIKVAELLKNRQAEISHLIERADRYARMLQAQTLQLVLCHSDLHAGNIFIGANGGFYFVDWDNPILAPKERDLMFPGGAQGFSGHTPQEEESLFFKGYGKAQIDPTALSYYRYERIIQDIAVYCEQLLLSTGGGEDREQSLRYLMSNFLPNNTIDIAYRSDKTS